MHAPLRSLALHLCVIDRSATIRHASGPINRLALALAPATASPSPARTFELPPSVTAEEQSMQG